jgi:hypothetical protein
MLCSPGEVHRRCGGMCSLHLEGQEVGQASNQEEAGSTQSPLLAACLACCATLKMAAVCSFKTTVNFCQSALCHIPENRILH